MPDLCSIEVIHHENCCARQTPPKQSSEHGGISIDPPNVGPAPRAVQTPPLRVRDPWVWIETTTPTASVRSPVVARTKAVTVLSDVGLKLRMPPAPEDLYEIINARDERGSLIITPHRALPNGPICFQSPLLASPALDRLTLNAHQPMNTGDSYRRKASAECPVQHEAAPFHCAQSSWAAKTTYRSGEEQHHTCGRSRRRWEWRFGRLAVAASRPTRRCS